MNWNYSHGIYQIQFMWKSHTYHAFQNLASDSPLTTIVFSLFSFNLQLIDSYIIDSFNLYHTIIYWVFSYRSKIVPLPIRKSIIHFIGSWIWQNGKISFSKTWQRNASFFNSSADTRYTAKVLVISYVSHIGNKIINAIFRFFSANSSSQNARIDLFLVLYFWHAWIIEDRQQVAFYYSLDCREGHMKKNSLSVCVYVCNGVKRTSYIYIYDYCWPLMLGTYLDPG